MDSLKVEKHMYDNNNRSASLSRDEHDDDDVGATHMLKKKLSKVDQGTRFEVLDKCKKTYNRP